MSAIGKELAIISVGMSCQTTHQIRHHLEYIRNLSGHQDLREATAYFDWLIAPPERTAAFIDQGLPSFNGIDHFVMRGKAPYWQTTKLYYWHAFSHQGIFDIPAHYTQTKEKFDALKLRFQQLANKQRIIAIISNTQNNLDEVAMDTGDIDPSFNAAALEKLYEALCFYWQRSVELIVVTRPDRYQGPQLDPFTYYELKADPSEWKGDKHQWRALFEDYFSR